MLTHLDAPDIEVMFIESDDGYGPFGAKSMGEAGKIPAVAAVANAIFNATGSRMKDLPITRDKILGAMRMKTFANANPRDLQQAVTLAQAGAARRPDSFDSPAAAAICSAW